MKILLTGACGFIGSHLCEKLLASGHSVIGVDDLSNGKLSNVESIKDHPNFHLYLIDITSPYFGDAADLSDIDWIFHLAAKADIVPSIENPLIYHKTNVDGTIKMLELARRIKATRFIYAASSSCYGIPSEYPTPEAAPCHPMYPYALTKYVGEQYVLHWSKLYKIPAISLRLFNVYGPRHRTSGAYGAVFGVFLSQLANNKPITIVGSGEQKRDFTYVEDVADAFVAAADSNIQGVMNVGSDGCYSVNYLADLLGAKERINIPNRPGEPEITFAHTGKIFFNLAWRPKWSFEAGVSRMKELIGEYADAPLWTPEKIEKATEAWFGAFQ